MQNTERTVTALHTPNTSPTMAIVVLCHRVDLQQTAVALDEEVVQLLDLFRRTLDLWRAGVAHTLGYFQALSL